MGVLAASCAGRINPALDEAQRHLDAHDWKGALERAENVTKADTHFRLLDPEGARGYFIMSQAWLELGHPAQALKEFDAGLMRAWWVDEAHSKAKRAAIVKAFRSSIAGPATCALQATYQEDLGPDYHLLSVKLVLDDHAPFAWQATAESPLLPLPARVFDADLAAGDHYVTFEARLTFAAFPNYRAKVRTSTVVACTKGEAQEATWTMHHNAGPDLADLDVVIHVQSHPLPGRPAARPPQSIAPTAQPAP